MGTYCQAAPLHFAQPWGPAVGAQPLPAPMVDILVLQAQLAQLQSPYAGCALAAPAGPPRHATATPVSAAPEAQGLQAAGTGVFIPQYNGRWTRRRQRNRSPRRDKQCGGKAGLGGAHPSHPGSPTSTLQPLEARPVNDCPIAALPCDDDFTQAYSRH